MFDLAETIYPQEGYGTRGGPLNICEKSLLGSLRGHNCFGFLWPLPLLVPELSSILVLPLTPSYPFGRLSGYGATSLHVSLPPDPCPALGRIPTP